MMHSWFGSVTHHQIPQFSAPSQSCFFYILPSSTHLKKKADFFRKLIPQMYFIISISLSISKRQGVTHGIYNTIIPPKKQW